VSNIDYAYNHEENIHQTPRDDELKFDDIAFDGRPRSNERKGLRYELGQRLSLNVDI